MSLIRSTTPEVLYGDTTAKVRAFAALSHQYAAQGESLLAIHAAWAADINVVQAVMWERVMIASPQPDEQFFAIATTVSRALVAHTQHVAPSVDARDAVLAARASLALAFDEAAMAALEERFPSLDHLAGLPMPGPDAGPAHARLRLGDDPENTAAAAATQRRATAADLMATAVALASEGHVDEALSQAWQADWLTLEAYLLDAAAAVGDTYLVSVDLRWALAYDVVCRIPNLPEAFAEAVSTVRATMAAALGPIEGARLHRHFAPAA